jgi:hypothetical protein
MATAQADQSDTQRGPASICDGVLVSISARQGGHRPPQKFKTTGCPWASNSENLTFSPPRTSVP